MFFMAAVVIVTVWKRITLSEDEDEEEEGEGEGEEEGVDVEEVEDVRTESSGGDESPEKGMEPSPSTSELQAAPEAPPVSSPDPPPALLPAVEAPVTQVTQYWVPSCRTCRCASLLSSSNNLFYLKERKHYARRLYMEDTRFSGHHSVREKVF